MRFLAVNCYARITGGADTLCFDLIDGLRELGHDVALLAVADERNTEETAAPIPLTASRETRDGLTRAKRLRTAGSALWNPHAARATESLISEFKPDVVHLHKLYTQISVAPAVVAARRGVPIMQTIYDYEFLSANPSDDLGGRFDRREVSRSYRSLNTALGVVRRRLHVPRVDRWVSLSRYLTDRHAEAGIDATTVPACTRLGAEGAEPVAADQRHGVALLSRLVEEKGVRDAIELARLSPDLEVVIAGQGPLEGEVVAAAATLPNLTFKHWLDRTSAAELVGRSKVVLMPSRWAEPAGLVALEAMAAGTPVVAYDVGGLAEYVADAGGGIVVPKDVAALTGAVRSLHDDDSLWSALSDQGRRAVKARHTPAAYAERIAEVAAEATGA